MIYASKLMMQPNYIKRGLIHMVENDVYGKKITIESVRDGKKAFTYCGTLPTFADGVISTKTSMMSIWPAALDLYITSKNALVVRALASGAAIVPTYPENYEWQTLTNTEVQPYVAFTLYFPTETSQIMTFQFEDKEKFIFEGYWSKNTSYNDVVTRVGGGTKEIDTGLVYDRVLEDNELRQNYREFLRKHR